VFWACEFGFLLGCGINYYLQQYTVAWLSGISAIALYAVLWQLNRGRSAMAGTSIIIVVTVAVTLLIWSGLGAV